MRNGQLRNDLSCASNEMLGIAPGSTIHLSEDENTTNDWIMRVMLMLKLRG